MFSIAGQLQCDAGRVAAGSTNRSASNTARGHSSLAGRRWPGAAAQVRHTGWPCGELHDHQALASALEALRICRPCTNMLELALQALLQPVTAGVAIGPDIDFGVQQLVGSVGGNEAGDDLNDGTNSAQQQPDVRTLQPGAVLLRHFRLQCRVPAAQCHLADVSAVPAQQGRVCASSRDCMCLCMQLPRHGLLVE